MSKHYIDKYLLKDRIVSSYAFITDTKLRQESFVQIIEEMPEVKIPSIIWNDVNFNLPSSGEIKLVTIKDDSGDSAFYYVNVGWYSGYDNKWVVDNEYTTWVTHWAELPEPVKG